MSEPESAARIHVTKLVGAAVTGRDGARLGTISDLMIDARTGAIAYIALAVGGVLSLGERLYAVPWSCLQIAPAGETITAVFCSDDLAERDGFDKDAWPSDPDSQLLSLAEACARFQPLRAPGDASSSPSGGGEIF